MRVGAVGGTARAIADFRRSLAAIDGPGPRPDPQLPRGIEWLLLKLLGRPITCAACGKPLFVGLPLVWRGELWLIGAYDHQVRVSFVSSQTMEFTHVELDQCATPARPWAG
jgi:hypothetical protein